jgi:hypothetical protein
MSRGGNAHLPFVKEDDSVECQRFEEANVGKRVKASKKRMQWQFRAGTQDSNVECTHSLTSGMVRLFVNGCQEKEVVARGEYFGTVCCTRQIMHTKLFPHRLLRGLHGNGTAHSNAPTCYCSKAVQVQPVYQR